MTAPSVATGRPAPAERRSPTDTTGTASNAESPCAGGRTTSSVATDTPGTSRTVTDPYPASFSYHRRHGSHAVPVGILPRLDHIPENSRQSQDLHTNAYSLLLSIRLQKGAAAAELRRSL